MSVTAAPACDEELFTVACFGSGRERESAGFRDRGCQLCDRQIEPETPIGAPLYHDVERVQRDTLDRKSLIVAKTKSEVLSLFDAMCRRQNEVGSDQRCGTCAAPGILDPPRGMDLLGRGRQREQKRAYADRQCPRKLHTSGPQELSSVPAAADERARRIRAPDVDVGRGKLAASVPEDSHHLGQGLF